MCPKPRVNACLLQHNRALDGPCIQSGRAFPGRERRMWTLVLLYSSGWIKSKAHIKLAKENSKYIVAKILDEFLVSLPAIFQDPRGHDLYCSLLSFIHSRVRTWVALGPYCKQEVQYQECYSRIFSIGFLCTSSVLCFSGRLWIHSGGQHD